MLKDIRLPLAALASGLLFGLGLAVAAGWWLASRLAPR